MKDEEQREKVMIKIKQKLSLPEMMPELYQKAKAEEEKQNIENDINRCIDGGGKER